MIKGRRINKDKLKVTKILIWVLIRTKKYVKDEKRKSNKIVRCLIKEYKALLDIVEKKMRSICGFLFFANHEE